MENFIPSLKYLRELYGFVVRLFHPKESFQIVNAKPPIHIACVCVCVFKDISAAYFYLFRELRSRKKWRSFFTKLWENNKFKAPFIRVLILQVKTLHIQIKLLVHF